MLIIPAIDMKDHQAVRLQQGDMAKATVYSTSVVAMAEKWVAQGATRLHLVDLNGAFEGKPIHFDSVTEIRQQLPHIQIEIGGGIRTLETIERYIDHGVDFCILGTVAIKNPDLVFAACEKFPGQIILGIDAKTGLVATEGWDETSQLKATTVVKKFAGAAIESVIYTDIAKDGMLAGMNLEQISQMLLDSPFPVIASGGLTSLEDIAALARLPKVHGVIAGKAIYENKFSVAEAIHHAKITTTY